jgi:transposase
MLTLPPSVKIFAAVEPVDARKSFDGLSAVVRDGLGGDPMTGHLYVFINRRGDVAQILFWDRTGFVVMRKRLEAGTFRLVRQADGIAKHVEIDAAELGLMLEGIDLGKAIRRKRYRPEATTATVTNSAVDCRL